MLPSTCSAQMSSHSSFIEVTNAEISQEDQFRLKIQHGGYLARQARYRLHEFLRENTTRLSVANCAQNLAESLPGLGSRITTRRCRSPHACPLCTPQQMATKRDSIERVIKNEQKDNRSAYLATLTVGFGDSQDLKARYNLLSMAWAKMIQTSQARHLRANLNMSYVRVLEETYSSRGWNPHFHVLFFVDSTPGNALAIHSLIDKWVASLESMGAPSYSHAQTCDSLTDADPWRIAKYLTKHGYVDLFFDEDSWRANGAVSPLKLLQAAVSRGDLDLLAEWHSFEEATFKLRRVAHSSNLAPFFSI